MFNKFFFIECDYEQHNNKKTDKIQILKFLNNIKAIKSMGYWQLVSNFLIMSEKTIKL